MRTSLIIEGLRCTLSNVKCPSNLRYALPNLMNIRVAQPTDIEVISEMFRNTRLIKPKNTSLLLTLLIALTAFFGSQASPFIGYLLAILALLVIIAAMYTESIWPTRGKEEKPFVFSLFWGLMIGVLLPFLVTIYLEGGLGAVYEMLMN